MPQGCKDALLKMFAEHDSQEAARKQLFKYITEQAGPPEKELHYELQSVRSIANSRSEWPGITATWQET